jgi:hypothetical protein
VLQWPRCLKKLLEREVLSRCLLPEKWGLLSRAGGREVSQGFMQPLPPGALVLTNPIISAFMYSLQWFGEHFKIRQALAQLIKLKLNCNSFTDVLNASLNNTSRFFSTL